MTSGSRICREFLEWARGVGLRKALEAEGWVVEHIPLQRKLETEKSVEERLALAVEDEVDLVPTVVFRDGELEKGRVTGFSTNPEHQRTLEEYML